MWRRLGGAFLMLIGGLAIVAMSAIASVATANYVEWENAADNLTTIAMIALPPMLAGMLVALLGRWVYGDWSGRAPLLHVSSWVVRLLGFAIAAGLGFMLVMLLIAGVGPGERDVVAALGLGLMGGVALAALGFWIRPRIG
jgi:hypothetical protein